MENQNNRSFLWEDNEQITYTDEEIIELISECMGDDRTTCEHYPENALVDMLVESIAAKIEVKPSEKRMLELEYAVLTAIIEAADAFDCKDFRNGVKTK